MIEPAGDLIEVATDTPDSQYQRRIDARDGLAATRLGQATRRAKQRRSGQSGGLGLGAQLDLLGRATAEDEGLCQRLFGGGSARAGGVRRGGLPPLARSRVIRASV